MNWTWSLGECWWVVMKLVSLQKAGIWAGGGQGSGSMPQLLSTGEGEHSKVSMKRTAGMPLLMKDTWSLARPGRSSRSLGGHGDGRDVRATPGSDVAHNAAR